MVVVKTPNPRYEGVTAGVVFVNGAAEVEDEYLRRLLVRDYGYSEEALEKGSPQAEEQSEPAQVQRRPRTKTSAK
ncbi:hypothetical protein [Paenibacillus tengchongensis]|uniref:hypothetical protein n=1 Tax=Paenibacillus tengchongensis TaxID=2608684 RepID=UPI00124E8CED|nr:hypothetical protein [Paenibacillus tengchongensis]